MQEQGAEEQQSRMADALHPWVGQSVASYAAEHGDPISSVALDDQSTAFRWVWSGQTNGAVVPMGGTMMVVPSRQLQCTVVFKATGRPKATALKDFTITGYKWEGAC